MRSSPQSAPNAFRWAPLVLGLAVALSIGTEAQTTGTASYSQGPTLATGKNTGTVQVCSQRSLSLERRLAMASRINAENPDNDPQGLISSLLGQGILLAQPDSVIPGVPGGNVQRFLGALLRGAKWKNGRLLRVRYLDSEPKYEKKVEQYASVWAKYANITFDFGSSAPDAEIRLSFARDNKYWSALGCESLDLHAASYPCASMNLGWPDPATTSESDYKEYILHEFGHALGLIHEHQHPGHDIPWDYHAVLHYYTKTLQWKKDEVYWNIFYRYSYSETNQTAYDRQSIMIYAIPQKHTLGDYEVKWAKQLSAGDKKTIAKAYPKP